MKHLSVSASDPIVATKRNLRLKIMKPHIIEPAALTNAPQQTMEP